MKCRYCNEEIKFLMTIKGKRMPVDIEGTEPNEDKYYPEKHTSHFKTCKSLNKK